MANAAHLKILTMEGVSAWNKWRDENPDIRPDLRESILPGLDLSGADLSAANLSGAGLSRANLSGANLSVHEITGSESHRVLFLLH